MIGGIIGNILIDIPTVVICVIAASVVECFLILPGHLHHSLHKAEDLHPSKVRIKLDNAFNNFKNGRFRRWVENAIEFRWITVAIAVAAFIIAIGLVSSGRIKFTFFPGCRTGNPSTLIFSLPPVPGQSRSTISCNIWIRLYVRLKQSWAEIWW